MTSNDPKEPRLLPIPFTGMLVREGGIQGRKLVTNIIFTSISKIRHPHPLRRGRYRGNTVKRPYFERQNGNLVMMF